MRVLIAESEPNLRQALWLACEEGVGLTVVGAVQEAVETIALIKTTQPDILLLEWKLFIALSPELPPSLIVIVVGGDLEARTPALEAGAYAFVYTGDPSEKLLTLLQTVMDGLNAQS